MKPEILMRGLLILILPGIVLFHNNSVYANVTITATADRTTCSIGERIEYTVTLTGSINLPEIKPPDFKDFEIVSGPSSSTNLQIINGDVERSKSLSYIVRPRKTGKIRIPPATTTHKKKRLRSNSVFINVIKAQSPPSSNSIGKKGTRGKSLPDVFIVAKTDRDTVYLRQMLTVFYDLYFKVNVSNYSFPKLPNMRGFWQEEFNLPSRPQIKDVVVQGQSYKLATLRKVGLFPTRAGLIEIAPLTADITVEVPAKSSRRRSIWNDPFFSRNRNVIKTVSTEKIDLTVLDLPSSKKPISFSNDVGDFKLKVTYNKMKVDQHDAINLKVSVSGNGYLKTVKAPKLNLPDGFEQFDPTVEEKISTTGNKMRGEKTFNYLIIPRRAGNFKLKPIVFSYFNPESKKYITRKSKTVSIEVKPSTESEYSAGFIMSPEEVAILGSDIKFIKDLDKPLIKTVRNPYETWWFYFILLAMPLLYLSGIGTEKFIDKRMSDPVAVRLRRAPEGLRKAVISSKKLKAEGKLVEALAKSVNALIELISALMNESSAGITGFVIEKGLREKGFDENLISKVLKLIAESDSARFGDFKIDEPYVNNCLDECMIVLEKLEKHL